MANCQLPWLCSHEPAAYFSLTKVVPVIVGLSLCTVKTTALPLSPCQSRERAGQRLASPKPHQMDFGMALSCDHPAVLYLGDVLYVR